MTEPTESQNANSLNPDELGQKKDVNGLIDVVKFGSSGKKKTALHWLGQLGGQVAIQCLLETASKGEGGIAVRRNAIIALGHTGDHSVVEPLIYFMGAYQYPDVKRAAAEALGELRDERAVKPLAMLVNDEDVDVSAREGAIGALCKIGSGEAFACVMALLNDSTLGSEAATALVEAGEKAVPSLVTLLEDVPHESKVVELLSKIGNKEAAEPLLHLMCKKIALDFGGISETNCSDLPRIMQALIQIGEVEFTSQAVEKLLGALVPARLITNHDNLSLQCNLLFALGESQDKQAIKPILLQLQESNDEHLKNAAAYALGMLGPKIDDLGIIQQLAGVLKEEGKQYGYIAWALIQSGDEQGYVAAMEYLKNTHIENIKNLLFPSKSWQ